MKKNKANLRGHKKRIGHLSNIKGLEERIQNVSRNKISKFNKKERRNHSMKRSFVNHHKTIAYNSRDRNIEEFAKAMLIDNPKAYESPLCLLNNCFNVIHLAIFQILIPALPHAPEVLLVLLVLLETIFFLLTLIPLVFRFRFLSWVEISEKVLRFFFMAGFFSICLIISLKGDGRQHPVSKTLQSYGMLVLLIGIILNFLMTFIKAVISVIQTAKVLLTKKKTKKKSEEEKLYDEQRGLIFYSEYDLSKNRKGIGSTAGLNDWDNEDSFRNDQPDQNPSRQDRSDLRDLNYSEESEEEKDHFDFLNINKKGEKKRKEEMKENFGLNSLKKKRISWSMIFHELSKRLANRSKMKEDSKVVSKNRNSRAKSHLVQSELRHHRSKNKRIDITSPRKKSSMRRQNRGLNFNLEKCRKNSRGKRF